MSATVAYLLLSITVLAIFAVGAVGWLMVDATLSEEDEESEPPSSDRRAV